MKRIRLALISLCIVGCTASVKTPENITGKAFPQVHGQSLSTQSITIPDQFKGKVVLLLIGYKQDAQFDIDRWILGALQAAVKAEIVEVPTIAGMMPRAVQGFIDNGMRSGIPKEDWASVVTVYEDASKIIEILGNERPKSAYAVVLNKNGEIVWTSNRGYSAGQVLELKKVVDGLLSSAANS